MGTLVCRHCGRKVQSNKKLKHLVQHYCGEKACQAARKLNFERHKYKTHPSFRFKKLQSARERKKKQAEGGDPLFGSRYQREYRAAHPDYVRANRQKQRTRDARARDKIRHESKIVNPDAIMMQRPDNDKVYAMIAVDYQKIVNPDALMSQLIDSIAVTKTLPMFVQRL